MDNKTEETMRLLADVERSIRTVLAGGQSVTIGDRTVIRPTLSKLNEMKSELEAQLTDSASDCLMPNTYVAMFDRR